jgi:hypothetical protein
MESHGGMILTEENKISEKNLSQCHFVYQKSLAVNYKQHILSPAKVIKVYYSLVEVYVQSVHLIYFGEGGVKFMKHFNVGGGRNLNGKA